MDIMDNSYSEITYFDKDGNIASKDDYDHSIITVYKDNTIIEEVFSINPDKYYVVEDTDEEIDVKIMFVNNEGIEVPESEATYCITQVFKENHLVGNYKDKLYKKK